MQHSTKFFVVQFFFFKKTSQTLFHIMHGWGISLFSWVRYRKLQQKEWFEKLHVKTCYRKSLSYKNRGKFEIRQHTARGTEKRQGTFRDQHRSCFLGKPALGAELSSWEGTHFSLEQGVMGQPLGEPCSGANRLTRRNVAWTQHSALPGRNGSHLLYFLFFSFKAAVSYSSCPGAVCTESTTFTKQYPLAAAAAVCASVLHFHSLLIPLLSLQTPYPEREDKCEGV